MYDARPNKKADKSIAMQAFYTREQVDRAIKVLKVNSSEPHKFSTESEEYLMVEIMRDLYWKSAEISHQVVDPDYTYNYIYLHGVEKKYACPVASLSQSSETSSDSEKLQDDTPKPLVVSFDTTSLKTKRQLEDLLGKIKYPVRIISLSARVSSKVVRAKNFRELLDVVRRNRGWYSVVEDFGGDVELGRDFVKRTIEAERVSNSEYGIENMQANTLVAYVGLCMLAYAKRVSNSVLASELQKYEAGFWERIEDEMSGWEDSDIEDSRAAYQARLDSIAGKSPSEEDGDEDIPE